RDFRVFGISHITGGGFFDNIPRMLPNACKAVIQKSSWTPPPIFPFLKKMGGIEDKEMMRVFNNGIGLVIVVSEADASEVLLRLKAMGETAYLIGWIESRNEGELAVQFTE
ncbi:MAG: phosphoribosylformylglycinamidine cyclo-ligase, partial [Deltaproteobacteria bacterium]|nr:phosphoribosylformylglycinamidine cyclo-ligase [Deltaproteobacteria bacterium]